MIENDNLVDYGRVVIFNQPAQSEIPGVPLFRLLMLLMPVPEGAWVESLEAFFRPGEPLPDFKTTIDRLQLLPLQQSGTLQDNTEADGYCYIYCKQAPGYSLVFGQPCNCPALQPYAISYMPSFGHFVALFSSILTENSDWMQLEI